MRAIKGYDELILNIESDADLRKLEKELLVADLVDLECNQIGCKVRLRYIPEENFIGGIEMEPLTGAIECTGEACIFVDQKGYGELQKSFLYNQTMIERKINNIRIIIRGPNDLPF